MGRWTPRRGRGRGVITHVVVGVVVCVTHAALNLLVKDRWRALSVGRWQSKFFSIFAASCKTVNVAPRGASRRRFSIRLTQVFSSDTSSSVFRPLYSCCYL